MYTLHMYMLDKGEKMITLNFINPRGDRES